MVKAGDSVELKDPEAIAKFGIGPYTVKEVRLDLQSVELLELGTVHLNDIGESIQTASPLPHVVKEKAPPLSDPVQTAPVGSGYSDEERGARMESIAGNLLSHPDPNVRVAMREMLNLLWG